MEYSDIQPLLNAFHRKLAATDLHFKRYLYENAFHRKLAATDLHFKRYLYDKIDWNVRLIGIKGARGVGKTTMLMQHIRETFRNPDSVLYVSLDNLWFNSHSTDTRTGL